MWVESSAVAKFFEAHGGLWSKRSIFQLLCFGVPGLISLLQRLDTVMWRSVGKSGKRVELFTPQRGRRVRGNGHQQKWERFRLIRKKGFTVRTTEHWGKLPREMVPPSSLEVFKTWLAKALGKLVLLSVGPVWAEGWARHDLSPLPTGAVLWFLSQQSALKALTRSDCSKALLGSRLVCFKALGLCYLILVLFHFCGSPWN